jgi:D-sedoheptulose 7-phosphate isomerase
LIWNNYIKKLTQILTDISFRNSEGQELGLEKGFLEWVEQTKQLKQSNNTIYFVGNGASASMASHMAADVSKNGRIRTQVFTDVSLITAIANDISYDEVFAIPLKLKMIENDMLIAISSSGNSSNIIRACEECRNIGGQVITLSAMKRNNPLQAMGDMNIYIPAQTYGWAESAHAIILHYWMDQLVTNQIIY